ncbi:MAG: PAS domain S-box protein [Methanoregula sp.]|uniref:sensor histidine kinase n=1 Tax=Methanoregula sp. TaxID=2052170 RepID=UPI003C197308
MADTFPQHRQFISDRDDLLRGCVIALLVALCIVTTILAFVQYIDILTTQFFFIPIIYAVYVFPKRGIIVSAICACAYEVVGYVFRYPDPVGLTAITIQAVLFVGIAGIIAFLIERVRVEETHYLTVFEYSQLGIVIFDVRREAIRHCNRKFTDMLGFTEKELQDMTFPDLLFTMAEKEQFQERMGRDAEIENFETRLRTKDGVACWVNLSWSRMDKNTVSCTAVNINARKIAEKAADDNIIRYRQLSENSPVGILIVQDSCIRYANPAFGRFLDMPVAGLSGKNFCAFADEHDRVTCHDRVKAWEEQSTATTSCGFGFRTASGELRKAELTATPIEHFGKPALLVNVINTTEKYLLEDKIELDNERRRGIMMTVAHELRTPLQPIMGYLNLLLQDPAEAGLTDETRKLLERCLASADRERQIINRMLDFSVLESGKLQLSCTSFSMAELIQSVITANGYAAQADISVSIPPDLNVVADMNRIFVAVDSILSNAIHYTHPPRTIVIAYHSDAIDPFHHISISDNGIGIPSSAQNSIFEPFQLADAAQLSRKFDRIGLSLAIAKKIMELHGGDITVQSTPGIGSTFTLHFPKTLHQ